MKQSVYPNILRPDKKIIHLDVIDRSYMTPNEQAIISTLQGNLAAHSEYQIFTTDIHSQPGNSNYPEMFKTRYSVDYTIQENPWTLLKKHQHIIKGFIVYKENTDSINVATSLAGLYDCIIVEESLVQKVKELEIKEVMNVVGKNSTWLINNYFDKFNKDIIIEVKNDIPLHLRDYSVFSKCICFYDEMNPERKNILSKMNEDTLIMGWGDTSSGSETKFIIQSSESGVHYLPGDWCMNMVILSNFNSIHDEWKMKPLHETPEDDNAHYVLFLMSDGDNMQWLYNRYNDPQWWGSKHRGKMPIGWAFPPTAVDFAPMLLDWHHETMTEMDGFVTAPSGSGFLFPSMYPREELEIHATRLNEAMKKLNMPILTILGYGSFDDTKLWDVFTQHDGVEAILYYEWDGWILHEDKCRINWSNDKPIIMASGKLFEMERANELVERLNTSSRDKTNADAYTLVYLNNWSGEDRIQDCLDVMNETNDDVHAVTPQQFVKLIKKHVKH